MFKSKHSGWTWDLKRTPFGGGKGGGGGAPSQTTSTAYQTNIPEYAQPYVETMLGATQKQLFNMDDSGNITGFQPYKPYSTNPQDYVAPFSPMQQQAQQGVADLTLPGTYQAGAEISGLNALQGMGLANQQARAGNQYQRQATSMYGPGSVGDYMNPYIAQSLAPQLQQLNQQFGIKGAQEQGAATSAGAFGGSRNALMQGLNQQNQMYAQQQAIAQGYDKAFQSAQQAQQFGANLGLQGQSAAQQGLGQATQAAGQMAGIGGQALEAQKGIYGAQATAGAQQQAQQQQMINQSITDYANAQQYPLMQLGTMSNMLRGLPMQSQTTNQYVAAPNPITQGIGLAGAGASIYNALGGSGAGKKAGGVIGMASGGIAGYNVGGSIRAKLEMMSPKDLQEYKSESPSVQDMVEEILRDKTGRAGGGIIAFANGTEDTVGADARAAEGNRLLSGYEQEVADRSAAKFNFGEPKKVVPATPVRAAEAPVERANPEMVRQAYIDAAKAQAANQPPAATPTPTPTPTPARPAVSNRMPVQPNGSDVPMVLGSPEHRASLAVENAVPVNPKSIVAAAPESVKAAPAAVPVAPVPTKPAAPVQAAPARPNAPASGDPFGIAPPVDPDAGKSIADLIKQKETYMGPNAGNQEARAGMMAERANAKDEARRATALRMAEFFGAWGSTPGTTIVAGLNALKNKVPDFISDMKEEAKVRRAIDKDIAELDKIDRLEKSGNWDEAAKRKDKLSKEAQDTWAKKVDAAAHIYTADKHLQAASVRASGAGGGGEGTAAKNLNQAITRYQTEDKNIAAEKKGDSEYKLAVAKLSAKPDDAKSLEIKNKKETAWNDRLAALKEDVDYYKKKQGRETGPSEPTPSAKGTPGTAGNPIVLK
jgi:hypothetical protein